MLRNTLDHENWMSVLSTDNANTAFDYFIEIFSMHYNLCCPMKRIMIQQYKHGKPWINKGLKCACRKTSKLYSNFLRTRNTHNEQKYMKYTNRLTKALRNCEKDYYSNPLNKYQNNIR